ncbi:hypothetical protein BUALT_Bualt09G0119800 [Buddleja alternifolia]|uniref:Uncharacterized protein n=1 Tax=Buddleja alternifolia TaxID=168488 RepID=A0AAV6X2D5_9LAMI|nr:hypothetical protein BUALT_Bualt09G0119800 [Buddleja alternifolia]
MKPSPESVETSPDMAHVLGQGRSSRLQQSYDAVKEKISPPSCTGKSLLFQDKHKTGHPFGQPYLDPKCEPRHNASTKQEVQSKSSENDELVKHMSNLPGFLRQVEKENNIQEKALNFGVLDWKRLEHWKYNERMPGKYPKKTSSTSKSFSSASGPPKMVPNLRKQSSLHGLNPSSLHSGKQPTPHGPRFSSPRKQPPPPRSLNLNSSKEERNATHHKEGKYVKGIESQGKETFNQEFQAAKSRAIDDFHQKVKFNDRSSSKINVNNSKGKDPKKEVMSKKETSSSERGKHKCSPSSDNKINAQGKKRETRLNDEVNSSSECCPPDPQNIMLLVPKHFKRTSCSETSQFTESRTSLDGQLAEAVGNRLSDFFSPEELYSRELSVDIPHSCPLPSGAIKPQNAVTTQTIDVDICTSACPSEDSLTSITSEGKCSMVHEKTTRPSSSEASRKTQADIAEQPNVKGRPPSPTRRFSFNLGRMSRSFSFKESSEVPQWSSTYATVKSGPVKPGASSGMEKFEKDKANASSKGRSSPLRRLLDPLLNYKGAQSAETVRPPNGILNSMIFKTMDIKGSTFQALLQLSLKNGLPFFKLVVDNSNDMLAAVVKRLPTSGKVDHCMIYTFYSVHEIRNKSTNWMSQGSKSKNCSLGYNIVGQMKISRSCHGKVSTTYSDECDERECVLYGFDPGQVDKQTPEFVPNKEIAAFVVKNSSEKLNNGTLSDENQLYNEQDPEENKTCNSTVVILPGGVHGIPIKGAPSSLISRWRSRGSCDCGGWDVGCKLRILTNASSANDRVNLFVQGGEKKGRPVFSLEPFSSGLYSIESDASISLLEAFATSVAYVTCQKFPEIVDMEDQSDAEYFPEAIETDKTKTSTTFQRQVPPKYVTCPPLSPAGRI